MYGNVHTRKKEAYGRHQFRICVAYGNRLDAVRPSFPSLSTQMSPCRVSLSLYSAETVVPRHPSIRTIVAFTTQKVRPSVKGLRHVTRWSTGITSWHSFGHINYSVASTTPYGRQASLIHRKCDSFISLVMYSSFGQSLCVFLLIFLFGRPADDNIRLNKYAVTENDSYSVRLARNSNLPDGKVQ